MRWSGVDWGRTVKATRRLKQGDRVIWQQAVKTSGGRLERQPHRVTVKYVGRLRDLVWVTDGQHDYIVNVKWLELEEK